jgi:hypothetical protein
VLAQLSPDEGYRLTTFVGLPDFEQVAIQLTGLTLQRKSPRKYLDDLRQSLSDLLRLHSVASGHTAERLAALLLDQLQLAVVSAVGEVGGSRHPADMPGITASVSARAAAAARNSQLLERFENIEVVNSFTKSVRAQIGKLESNVRPPQMTSGRKFPLSRLYIDRQVKLHGSTPANTDVQFAPKDLLSQQLRAVVLGDPGGGKSTLATKLCSDLARSRRADDVVPFMVVMRDFAQHFERDQLSVVNYLRVLSSGRYQVEATADCIEFLLLNGRAVLFLDGLDELLDTSLRHRVIDAVEAFAHAYPLTPMLVTSRLVGYDQAPLDPALFATYRLSEFDDAQVEAYANKWFALESNLPRANQQELVATFLREGEYVRDLRRNPLMLALMCALYRGEGYIPRNRLDVYERCSTLLFEGWDRSRGIRMPLPFHQHVRPAMWSLALSMLEANDARTAWTERQLVNTVRKFLLERRFEDVDEAEQAAGSFVAYCRGRAWVLTEVGTTGDGDPLFAFTHRTFLEYFSANQLVRKNPTASDLFAALVSRIDESEWDVVAQLAVLLLDRNVDGGADLFLGLLLQHASEQEQAEHRTSVLTFATRLMKHVVPAPATTRQVFDVCWSLAAGALDDDADMEPLSTLLASSPENQDSVADMIRQRAAANDLPGMSAVVAVTLDQVCDFAGNPDPRIRWYRESRENIDLARRALITQAPTNMQAAMELVFCGGMTITELVTAHGPAAVCEPPLIFSTYRRSSIIQQVAIASHDITWQRWFAHIAIESDAATWSDDIASVLPLLPTPWARLSRLPYWDMTIDNPPNSTPPGTPLFDVLVLCGCLYAQAREVVRARYGPTRYAGLEPLPSWLRFSAPHPVNTVIDAARRGAHALEEVPEAWLSPATRQLVRSWASGEISLVEDDLG